MQHVRFALRENSGRVLAPHSCCRRFKSKQDILQILSEQIALDSVTNIPLLFIFFATN